MVERELHARENEVRELREELSKAEWYNEALLRELSEVRAGTSAKLSPELCSQVHTVKEIVLGRQTGGYDQDRCPGDDALQVVVEPRDPDGHALKAPGELHVTLLQVDAGGVKTPISSWDVPPDQLRRTWRQGLLSTGYHVILPWKVPPTTSKMRVVVQFILADGRVFEADKDFTIRLPPGTEPRGPALPTLPSEPVEPLPLPRKAEPSTGPSVSAKPTAVRGPATILRPVPAGTVP
ncbi:MAG: hypothetical protein NZ700_09375 [Gemmataceae bacterium]|nr:hypothetical protein [Gemmataceae bacterium]MDW8266822.1 hypothetical protein [Gemmataceae bacterium]